MIKDYLAFRVLLGFRASGFLLGLTCISVLAARPQESSKSAETITVGLEASARVVSMHDHFLLTVNVRNNSAKPIYLVLNEDFTKSIDAHKRQLGLGFDKQPANFHYFEFPKLKRIAPKRSTKVKVRLTPTMWKVAESGEWSVLASVGIIEASRLSNKMRALGIRSMNSIQMNVPDFLELQNVYYSDRVTLVFVE